jgi:nitrate/TMAO reductase-like tetraheme cytochrome c subunit
MSLIQDIWHITKSIFVTPIDLAKRFKRKLQRVGWRRTLLTLAVLFVIIAIGMTAFVEVTSQPAFCISCHYMKPYFASWQESSHKGVMCTECHIPPGIKGTIEAKFTAMSMMVNYTTGIYKRSKPWAEISNESCLRGGCHETRLLAGRVEFKEGIIFDHKPHLIELRLGKTLRCTSCHSQIVQGQHISVTSSTCFICHFKGADSPKMSGCTTCHDAPVRTAATPDVPFDHTQMVSRKVSCLRCHGSMQVGSGDVSTERCNSCHAELGKIDKYSDIAHIHNNHITERKVECQACHQEILHKSVSRTEMVKPSCEDCHQGTHEVQVDMFTGKGGVGVTEHPSTMFQSGLNCRGCHTIQAESEGFALKGTTMLASGVVCTPCHDQGYDRILEGWKRRNAERVGQIRAIESRVHNSLKGLTGTRRIVADSLVSAAMHNIQMVDLGHGIHNIPYAEALLGAAYSQLQSAYQFSGGKVPEFDVGLPKQSADCMNCHYGVETMAVARAGRSFPHSPHVLTQKLACTMCHSNEIKHGSLALQPADCNSCHHKPTAEGQAADCAKCHDLQASIYTGKAEWGAQATPDPMAESGLACTDCHSPEPPSIIRPSGEVCVGCHDPSYETLANSWKDDFQRGLARVDSLLHLCRNVKLPELEDVVARADRIRKDRSSGVHNHAMLGGILQADEKWLTEFIHKNGLDVVQNPNKPVQQ